MKKTLCKFVIALMAIPTIHAQTKQHSINLRCVGEMTETYKGMEEKKYQIERYYELSKDKVVEHIGTEIFQTTRKEIEKSEDSDSMKKNGYYRFEENQIIYNSDTEWKFQSPNMYTHRYFAINRQNGRWTANELYSGGLIELMGKGMTKHVSINGGCEAWNPKPKF